MTAVIPWGESKQVQLSLRGYVTQVYVVGQEDPVGSVHVAQWPDGRIVWLALTPAGFSYQDSLAEAIMWVLRRTAPKVWLSHRPVVYRVKTCLCHDSHLAVYDPENREVDLVSTIEKATKLADRLARRRLATINN